MNKLNTHKRPSQFSDRDNKIVSRTAEPEYLIELYGLDFSFQYNEFYFGSNKSRVTYSSKN